MKFQNNGIFIEERNFLLEWNTPVEKLAANFNAVVEKKGDYFYAYWGENSFIKGTGINLRTSFRAGTLFEELEYSVSGESTSLRNFRIIKDYVTEIIGQPIKKNNNDEELIWISSTVKIKLEIEDFRGIKLHLVIKKNNSS
jgi:hypothetical protein